MIDNTTTYKIQDSAVPVRLSGKSKSYFCQVLRSQMSEQVDCIARGVRHLTISPATEL